MYSVSLNDVFGWLTDDDERKQKSAKKILHREGPPMVKYLILAANLPETHWQHAVTMLDLAEQIGGGIGFEEMLKLQALLRHRDSRVREKAERLIMSMCPGGVPDSPEERELMRSINPFLQPPPRRPRGKSRFSDMTAAFRGDQAAIRRRAKYNAARRREEEREQLRRS